MITGKGEKEGLTGFSVGWVGVEVKDMRARGCGWDTGRRFGRTPVTTTTWWTRDARARVHDGLLRIFQYAKITGTPDAKNTAVAKSCSEHRVERRQRVVPKHPVSVLLLVLVISFRTQSFVVDVFLVVLVVDPVVLVTGTAAATDVTSGAAASVTAADPAGL